MSPPDFARNIAPPSNLSNIPDPETQRGLGDMTAPAASGRVLHINLRFFKYGTSDQSHAAAVTLSMTLIVVLVLIACLGFYSPNSPTFDKIMTLVGNAMILVIGVAIGQKASGAQPDDKD